MKNEIRTNRKQKRFSSIYSPTFEEQEKHFSDSNDKISRSCNDTIEDEEFDRRQWANVLF